MTFKFRVGQMVRVIKIEGAFYWGPIGFVGAVIRREPYKDTNAYYLDGYPNPRGVVEESLRPVYDGDSPSTWSECLWRPNLEHPIIPALTEPTKEPA